MYATPLHSSARHIVANHIRTFGRDIVGPLTTVSRSLSTTTAHPSPILPFSARRVPSSTLQWSSIYSQTGRPVSQQRTPMEMYKSTTTFSFRRFTTTTTASSTHRPVPLTALPRSIPSLTSLRMVTRPTIGRLYRSQPHRTLSTVAPTTPPPVVTPKPPRASKPRGRLFRFFRGLFKYTFLFLVLSPILIPFYAVVIGAFFTPDFTLMTSALFEDKLSPRRDGIIERYFHFWGTLLLPVIVRIHMWRARRRAQREAVLAEYYHNWHTNRQIPSALSYLFHRSVNNLITYPVIMDAASMHILEDDDLYKLMQQCESLLIDERGNPLSVNDEIEKKISDVVISAGESIPPVDYQAILLGEIQSLNTFRSFLIPYYLESISHLINPSTHSMLSHDQVLRDLNRYVPFSDIFKSPSLLAKFPRAFQQELDNWEENSLFRGHEVFSDDYKAYLDTGFNRPLITRLLASLLLNEGSITRSPEQKLTDDQELDIFLKDITIPEHLKDRYIYDESIKGSKELAETMYLIDRVVGQNILEMIRIHEAEKSRSDLVASSSPHVDMEAVLDAMPAGLSSGGRSTNSRHNV